MQGRWHRINSLLPISGAAALLVFCLAGARLYVSSAGSAAFADGMSTTCRSSSALILPIPDGSAAEIDRLTAQLRHVEAPIRRIEASAILTTSYGLRRLALVDIDDIANHVTPTLTPLALGEVAMSRTSLRELAIGVGDTIRTDNGIPLTVTQVFDDVPYAPLPDYWCGWASLWEPTANGDPPAPSAIASELTLANFGGIRYAEFRIDRQPLDLTEADEAVRAFRSVEAAWSSRFQQTYGTLPANELPRLAARAHSVATTVDRSVTPVMLTAVVSVGLVLCAMAVLLARSRARELKLFAIRGVPPTSIARFVLPGVIGALAAGAVVGGGLAYVAVRALGPASLLETVAVQTAIVRGLIAFVVAIPVVAGVVAFVADRSVDRVHGAGHRRWALVVVALAPVALAAFSLRRLDRDGGIRTTGVLSRGGALLPMGFPLFALVAAGGVIALVLSLAVPRARLTGGRLRRSLRLGWRRAVLDTGPTVAVVTAVLLAAGCYTTSRALAQTATQQLRDKAAVYVGADLAMKVFDDPVIDESWRDRTTSVLTAHGRANKQSFDLLGIDAATFASVALTRNDEEAARLRADIRRIANPDTATGPPPTIVVGAGDGDVEVGAVVSFPIIGTSRSLELRVVGVRGYFPTSTNGALLYVVDRSVVDAAVSFPTEVLLVRDPPPDAVAQVRNAGVRVGTVFERESVFDGAAYSGLRWSYAPLGVLGILFGLVALTVQVLVAVGRSASRRATHVVMRRTGFGHRSLLTASVVELGTPLAVGAGLGAIAGVAASSLAAGRLDPMPLLQPPTLFGIPWASMFAIAIAVIVWTVLVATVITRSTVRADPVGVLHGEL